MYLPYFGFSEKPFNLTPDSRFLFLSEKHKEALGHLLYGVRERKGFIVITGEVGAGKTILSRALLHELARDGDIKTALLLNPSLSELDLLKSINEEFAIPSRLDTKKELIDELNNFLLEGLQGGKNAVLVIDEAQNLAPSVLEQIRLLSNLETEKEKLIQIVLIGQSELEANLQIPRLRQLNQRITVRFRLSPLDFKETRSYIYHRLALADGLDKVRFTRLALENIYRYTSGNPRRINILADRVLLAAYTRSTRKVSGSLVKRTAKELKSSVLPHPQKPFTSHSMVYTSIGIILLFLLLSGFYLYQSDLIRSYFNPVSPVDSALTAQGSSGKKVAADLKTTQSDPKSVISPAKEREAEAILPKSPDYSKELEQDLDLTKPLFLNQSPGASSAPLSEQSGPGSLLERSSEEKNQSTLQAILKESKTGNEGAVENLTTLSEDQPRQGSTSAEIGHKLHLKGEASLSKPSAQSALLWPLKENLEWLQKGENFTRNLKMMAQAFGFYLEEIETTPKIMEDFKAPFFIGLSLPNDKGEHFLLLDRPSPSGGAIVYSEGVGEMKYLKETLEKIWNGKALIPIRGLEEITTLLKFGMKGEQVSSLQAGLKELTYLSQEVNGQFDTNTVRAVRELQKDYGLQIDGYAGPRTKLLLFLKTGKI